MWICFHFLRIGAGKMGRRAVYDKINSVLSSGKIESESHYVIENGNVYWEVEYHHWSGHPGTQIAFMHFMSNGNYAVDITKQEFEKQTGKNGKEREVSLLLCSYYIDFACLICFYL